MRIFLLISLILFCSTGFGQKTEYRNLVMEGGSIRGIAYAGAMKVLDSAGILHDIERVAGTSAGAIQAMLVALGYTGAEMENIAKNTQWVDFNDGSFILHVSLYRLAENFGWYKGKVLRDWCESRIYQKTGVRNLTMRGLDSLRKIYPHFKSLYVVSTNISQQHSVTFSAETFPDMAVADAVYGSAAIPLYFEPMVLNRKQKRIPIYQADSLSEYYIDGGLLSNYPVYIFDTMSGKTLGLQLMRPEKLAQHEQSKVVPIVTIFDYIESCYEAILENQYARIITTEEEKNTIHISVGNIGPRIRRMSDWEVNLLITNGANAVRNFLHNIPN